MLTIEKVDTTNKKQVRRFIDVPFRLYKDNVQWVPPIRMDMYETLNRQKHPFYEHSTADFFIAVREGRGVGRIAVLENSSYNIFHGTRTGQFYFFDCEDDSEAAAALFERAFEWARARDLDKIVGPKGFSPFDGYGMLERVHRIADRVRKRQDLRVLRFKNKKELKRWAGKIGKTYNDSFVDNWEYVPLSDRELDYVVDNIMLVANPKLIKIIVHDDDVVGFAFGWPDASAAMQRSKGKLLPFGIFDLLLEMRRTKWMAGNGMGLLPEYQGREGNALLYSEMEKTIAEFDFTYCELTQVAESAVQMRRDLEMLGGDPYKNHRVFKRDL